MKTKKRIIAVAIIILCHSFCHSQQIQATHSELLREEKTGIDSSTYIFEGTVIKQIRTVFVCSVVSITKIYRGSPQIKIGTIKVITEAGDEDDPWDFFNGTHFIFFGKKTNSGRFQSIVTDNSIAVTWGGAPFLFNIKDGATWGFGCNKIRYETLDELNNFLKENGLMVQEEVEPADSAKQK